ncbi:unnamed protein product [Calypogeia fissa]
MEQTPEQSGEDSHSAVKEMMQKFAAKFEDQWDISKNTKFEEKWDAKKNTKFEEKWDPKKNTKFEDKYLHKNSAAATEQAQKGGTNSTQTGPADDNNSKQQESSHQTSGKPTRFNPYVPGPVSTSESGLDM